MYNGLTKLLDFDSTQGVIQDLTGLNTLTASNVTVNKVGKVFSAFFNGTSSNIISNKIANITNFTISSWSSIPKNTSTVYVICSSRMPSPFTGIYVYLSGGQLNIQLNDSSNLHVFSPSYTKLSTYTNFVLVVNSINKILSAYQNGVLLGTIFSISVVAFPINSTWGLYIGEDLVTSTFTKGYIPKVQIFQGIPSNPANFAAQIFNSQRGLFNV